MEQGGLRAVLGLGGMSEGWVHHCVWRAGKVSVGQGTTGHRIPEVTSGGTHGWTWRGESRATVGKQREPHHNPGKCWCNRFFCIFTLKTSIFMDFHIFGGKT